jgi:hypothetical protein
MWPSNVPNVSLDANAAAIQYAVGFTYDWYEEVDPVTGELVNFDGLVQNEV